MSYGNLIISQFYQELYDKLSNELFIPGKISKENISNEIIELLIKNIKELNQSNGNEAEDEHRNIIFLTNLLTLLICNRKELRLKGLESTLQSIIKTATYSPTVPRHPPPSSIIRGRDDDEIPYIELPPSIKTIYKQKISSRRKQAWPEEITKVEEVNEEDIKKQIIEKLKQKNFDNYYIENIIESAFDRQFLNETKMKNEYLKQLPSIIDDCPSMNSNDNLYSAEKCAHIISENLIRMQDEYIMKQHNYTGTGGKKVKKILKKVKKNSKEKKT